MDFGSEFSPDTIIALSSGSLPAGVAVVRASGPKVRDLLQLLAPDRDFEPRLATLVSLRGADGTLIDQALVIFFAAPHSFTGEDVAEFHLHGSKAVVARFLDEACGVKGVRLAQAGEFTRRAFANGKIDLIGAEGIGDLLVAETEAQRVLAMDQVTGKLREHYGAWRQSLLHIRAMLEAEIDFADEEDVPGSVSDTVLAQIPELIALMQAHLETANRQKFVRDGFQVAIVGAPNVGKSSLLNALAKGEHAIVTDIAGTTRDIIDVRINLDGNLIVLSDTAGLRETDDVIEQEGVARAKARAGVSQLVLYLSDHDDFPLSFEVPVWRILSKSDLQCAKDCTADFAVSSRTGEGLETLLSALGVYVRSRVADRAGLSLAQDRHFDLIEMCVGHLIVACGEDLAIEAKAEELRAAIVCLGAITGEMSTEDMLGDIFSNFCIGK